jgi:Na+/melibiose symporter-like transporter
MLFMGLMMAGAGTVDAITANLLPITAKHFTGNIALISFMVALNRICGFLVQPWAAFQSDRHRSAGGRRRPFLLVAWPATLVSVAVLGGLPFVVPAEYRHTTTVVALLFVANLAMQAFLDMCYGSGDPMYGDTFVSGDLGRATGVRVIISNVVTIGMTLVFVPLADRHEFYPYLGAMLFVAISWLVAGFLVKENIPAQLPPQEPYNPFKPLVELRNPQTRNVAIVASAVLVALALTEMLHALFVTETLGFSKTVLGQSVAAGFVVSLLCSYPLGHLVDRVGARKVLVVGFIAVAAVEALFVFWVHDLFSLYVGLILFKISWIVVHIPIVPLMYHNTPAERRGTIFAAIQTTRAGVTSLATILAGSLAGLVGSYRMCYLVAGVVCVVGLFGALRLEAPAKTRVPVIV